MSTRAQILAEIAAQFPDNTTGLITPAKLRQVVEDVTNSCLVSDTDAGTAGIAVLQAETQAQVRTAAGLAGLSTTGLIARTDAGTAATRTITGTANQVTVTNGDGVAGNPVLSLPQDIATTSAPQFYELNLSGAETIDSGVGLLPAALANTLIRTACSDTQGPRFEGVGFASAGITFSGRSASGTRASPSASVNDMLFLTAHGYDGTSWVAGAKGSYRIGANGTWSETNNGTYHAWAGTSNGSTSPVDWMDLRNGSLRLTSYGAGTLVTDSSGNVTASSDASLKTVTGPFTRGLADVLKLTPRTYRWNEKSGMDTEDENVGFIAQEVLEAIPEAVGQYRTSEVEVDGKKTKKREKAELLTLSDRPLIAALVNAVKELKAENDELRKRLDRLETKKGNTDPTHEESSTS